MVIFSIVAYAMLFTAILLTLIFVHAMIDAVAVYRNLKDKIIVSAFCLFWVLTVLMLKHFG